MRKLVFVAVFYAAAATAATSPLWGPLRPGPYAVGFQQWDRYDYTRPFWTARDLDGKPRTRERARPMRISMWYPASPSAAPFLTLGDYVSMIGGEDRLGALTEEQRRNGRATLYRFPVLRDLNSDQRTKLESIVS